MTKPDLTELDLLPGLAEYPRAALFSTPPEIEPLPRLGPRLGITLEVKRDDLLPIAMGGNKVRQLEYYLGEALARNADSVLITGAVQSNFVRLCAASARKLGLEPHIQLEQRVPKDDAAYVQSGNVLLNQLLGAAIYNYTGDQSETAADANLDVIASDLRRAGKSPYVIHLGTDHPPLGGLGYARAAAEMYLEYQSRGEWPDHVVLGSGSGLTNAGFLAGARAIGWDVAVHGICVRRPAQEQAPRILNRTREICRMLGSDYEVRQSDIRVDGSTLNPGYGQMSASVSEAIQYAAFDEGLLVDPVYTGRALAGLIVLSQAGTIARGHRVVFIHTGGLPAIFAYQTDLLAGVRI